VSDVHTVQFSPDGGQLAVGVWDGTVHLLDARPLTDAVREEREVRALLDSVHQQELTPDEIKARLRDDHSLGTSLRRRALELAPLYRHDPAELHDQARETVLKPGLPAERYRQALRRAEFAAKEYPRAASDLGRARRDVARMTATTLGFAHFRVGHYEKALTVLGARAELAEAGQLQGDVELRAVVAMCLHRLGKADRARRVMEDLRKTMKEGEFADNESAQAFFREAEALFADRGDRK
jgi:hypothetical protein